ncbi:MAG: 3-keto-5-aminohexanoate cleavage protein, partial [Sciscionella sp.]
LEPAPTAVMLRTGVEGGLPATAGSLVDVLRALPVGTCVIAGGAGARGLAVLLAALACGAHLRVGMADTQHYAADQPAEGNAQLIARAAGLARIAQRPPISPKWARTICGVPAAPGTL